MDESELLFNLFYLLFSMVIIYPPEEFKRIGLTIDLLFARILGDEKLQFIRYHQRRTALNIIVHSCLPAMYFIIHQLKFSVFASNGANNDDEADVDPDFPMPQEAVKMKTLVWKMVQRLSLLALVTVPLLICYWHQHNWQRHPISKTLAKYASAERRSYETVASEIDIEARRPENFTKQLNSISTLITTENWIIKTSLYNVYFAHQSDVSLSVSKTESYNTARGSNDVLHIINIAVKPNRAGVAEFSIRINAPEFETLERCIRRPISVPANINFPPSIVDRFINAFKEQVNKNIVYNYNPTADADALEKCYACMTNEPNVKINKQCLDVDVHGAPLPAQLCCTKCSCRPMWCVDCLARWFMARQSDYEANVWMAQKCNCPMCRALFCVLDVSYIRSNEQTAANTTEASD